MKNLVICCDGTGNEIEANLSNVLKLFRVVGKTEDQIVYYDPGIGTVSSSDAWSRAKARAKGVFGLLTGYGLDENMLGAYRFLIEHYEEGDQVYLFGFSRGAYTVRALGGFLQMVGLLKKPQSNLGDYALTAYKRAAETNEFSGAWRYESVAGARRVPIRFMGVWDTVASVFVPRPDRLYWPSMQVLPFTKTNPLVQTFRQAMAIDERRRLFRIYHWADPQPFKPNRFDPSEPLAQDVKQVWFAGFHSDVGGGFEEDESGIAKYPLKWMIDEALLSGLRINRAMYNHLVLGRPRKGGTKSYAAPSPGALVHDSMSSGWLPFEIWPKRLKWRDWPARTNLLGLYLPLCEPRHIDDGSLVHHSVFERIEAVPGYGPKNLPPKGRVRVEPSPDAKPAMTEDQ